MEADQVAARTFTPELREMHSALRDYLIALWKAEDADRVVSLPVRSSKLIGSPIYCGTSASPVPTAVSGAHGAIQAAGTDSHKGEEEDNREQAPSSHNTTHTSMDVDEGNSDEKALLGSSYHPHAVSSDHSEYVNTDSDEDSGTEMGEEMDEGGDTGMGKEGW
ncbi:hypothetical protein H2199_005635 [Coniosporium tulheliwenetii]|uniref:Uncharacterized protein n=1 Tax=Coniosporium tulheliwenetii TaxID=3383036 RepID=A0ACC2YZV5_9PEZI|nr:hypothetical protein H2199_005635 [Cladosporium sp. JES 115]